MMTASKTDKRIQIKDKEGQGGGNQQDIHETYN